MNFCLERDPKDWFSIRKRAFEIALEIFQDIIPGLERENELLKLISILCLRYRIRSIVETDKV